LVLDGNRAESPPPNANLATIGEKLEGMKLREGEHLPEPSIYAMDDDENPSTPGDSHDTPMCNTPTGCVPHRFSSPFRPVSDEITQVAWCVQRVA
jgi:hypothetical protein